MQTSSLLRSALFAGLSLGPVSALAQPPDPSVRGSFATTTRILRAGCSWLRKFVISLKGITGRNGIEASIRNGMMRRSAPEDTGHTAHLAGISPEPYSESSRSPISSDRTTACVRSETPSFWMMCSTWFLTVPTLM